MDNRWVKVDKKNDGIYYNEKKGTWGYRVCKYHDYRRTGFMTKAEAIAEREALLEELEKRGKI